MELSLRKTSKIFELKINPKITKSILLNNNPKIMVKRIVAIIALAGSSYAHAQDSAAVNSGLKISGWSDVYYRYNFADSINNYTSFTNSQNSFELGMISLKAEHSFGKVGVVGDLGFGKRAEEFSYNDDNTQLAIKQLYITYSPAPNFKLTAGSWATHMSYEVVDAPVNRNYSTSYMFTYGPFFHTGIKGELTVGKSSFMLGLTNPTDLKSANFSKKYLVGQYSVAFANDKAKIYLNAHAGKASAASKNNQFEIITTATVSDKFNLAYHTTLASYRDDPASSWENYWGMALYLNYDPVSSFGLTLRTEYLQDNKAILPPLSAPFTGIPGGNIIATTLSGNIRLNGLTFIPEFRLENASKEIFYKNSGAGTKTSATALIAAVYKF